MYKKTTILLILVFGWVFGQQDQEKASLPSVQVMATAQGSTVLLRWAVDQPIAWKRANDYGFQIERFTVARSGKVLAQPEKEMLTPSPVKAQPLEQWQSLVEKNDYAAILAQAIYGESFAVEGNQEGGLMQILNKANELEQRFSFALFAADMNFEAAKLAGYGYVDSTAKTDEKYLYRITAMVPQTIALIETGTVVIEPAKIEPLPAPIDLIAVGQDKTIMLTWEYEMFKPIYTSYFIERSEDGVQFNQLGDTPLVNMNDKPGKPAKRMIYMDTIPQNGKTYHYRVKGVSTFGKTGPPSTVVKAEGVKPLEKVPHITRGELRPDGSAKIQWEFPKEAEQDISGFDLNRASKADGIYTTVVSAIGKTLREYTYSDLEPSNYFTITAKGNNGSQKTSLAVFVQTIDSIPPQAPLGLKGVIDTTGVVTLSWNANTDKDMLGYRVFRGNLKGEELSQITVDPIVQNQFIDTVTIASLNSKVYYSIVAVDQRFNMSEYSEELILTKPDKVPPNSPVFSKYKIQQDGIFLSWANSSSTDVAKHILYRQDIEQQEKEWQIIFQTDTISSYIDASTISGKKYRYAIFAEDHSGLTSAPSTPITLSAVHFNPEEMIKGLRSEIHAEKGSIVLFWRVADTDKVKEIAIYKSKNQGKPKLFVQLPVSKNTIEDSQVYPNTKYTYYLKPIVDTGSFATFKTIDVNY